MKDDQRAAMLKRQLDESNARVNALQVDLRYVACDIVKILAENDRDKFRSVIEDIAASLGHV